MKILELFKKKVVEEKPAPKPPGRQDQWITDILESVRDKGGAKLWQISYTTSAENEWQIVVEGTVGQVCRFILSKPGELKHFSASALETPRVLR